MITVQNNQSVFDLAVRYCGTAAAAFDLAELNGISVTDRLTPGNELEIPEKNYGRYEADVTAYFEREKHQPATAWPIIQDGDLDDFGMLPGMLPLILS